MFSSLFPSKEQLKEQFLQSWQIGDLPDAARIGEKLVKKDPQDYQNLNDLGMVYLLGNDPTKALGCFQRANAVHENAIHWNNLGRALQALKAFDDAFKAYERARELDDQDPQPWYNTSVCQREAGDMEASYRTLLDIVGAFPRHAGARNDLALHLEIQGQHEEAIEHLDAALQADPDYDPARQNVVRILCDKDQLERAMGYLNYWKQRGWSVEVETRNKEIRIKVRGLVFYDSYEA